MGTAEEVQGPHTQQENLEERPRGCKEEANSGAGGGFRGQQ